MENHHKIIANELKIRLEQVKEAAVLLAEGGTIPFIARYRKEATGQLDELQISIIRDRLRQMVDLDKRRLAIIGSLADRSILTGELKQALMGADDMTSLEDIYLPYRIKRRTRSMIAREKGLEPLACHIFAQDDGQIRIADFIDRGNGVCSAAEALAGARDIIAEMISNNSSGRGELRKFFTEKAIVRSVVCKGKEESGSKFKDYFNWQESSVKIPGHRLLAMLRGEKERVLSLSIRANEEEVLARLRQKFVKNNKWTGREVGLALVDSYRRLLGPALENELRITLKERADKEAIQIFADNLRELLLAPALGQKRVMALDPGFRSGVKLVCLDRQGGLTNHTVIYPTHSAKQAGQAGKVVAEQCKKYNIEAIAVGNGTAGRETEAFIRSLDLPGNPVMTMVDESGASIYSASEIARKEFPDHDLTVRGAVSIGRRLQDPLAELIKLDPKVIGVGQYQHDVNQRKLKKSLEDVVISCVNKVGVDINTASVELLSFVAGLSKTMAANIVKWRNEQGPFLDRRQLLTVPRFGAKSFEQCAGFIRIRGGKNPLDASGVHPERYDLVERLARDAGCPVAQLMADQSLREGIEIANYLGADVGLPTMTDIMIELAKPGRDPRDNFKEFFFAEGVNSIEDLKAGMRLPGIITNVTKFGAFVDIGIHQDGLIHISQLAEHFVGNPGEVVKVRQQVEVAVLSVDMSRKRVALSLREKCR